MRLRTLVFLASAVLSTFAQAAVTFEIPERDKNTREAGIQELRQRVSDLNRFIGSWPARASSDDERRAVYKQWSAALQQAWLVEAKDPDSESTLALLADIYRQGHNLDVNDSGRLADQSINCCLADYPDSIPCNFTASYFYLSVNPKFAPKGEASLAHLRELLKPKVNLEMEKGFVFAYLYEGKKDQAKTQLEYFLTLAPDAEWAHKMLDNLVSGKIVQRNQ